VTVAGTQLVITTLLRTRRVKKFFGVDGYLPGTYLYKLVRTLSNQHKKSKEGPPNFTSEQLKGLSAKNAEQAGALNQANTSNSKKHEEKPVSEAPKAQNPNVSFQKPKKK
jgi:hypothetical protein